MANFVFELTFYVTYNFCVLNYHFAILKVLQDIFVAKYKSQSI